MMKKFVLSLLVVMTGLIIISCNGLVTPSKVQVKGSPSVYAPLGSKTVTLSEYLNTDDIIKMMGADKPDSTMTVYEYPFTAGTTTPTFAPGVADDNMRFLVHYPLTSVDLDFSQYLENIDLAGGISADFPAQTFIVPNIANPDPITINFNSALLISLNAISAFPVSFLSTSAGSLTVPAVSITLTGFEDATFSAGSMDFVISAGTTAGLSVSGVRILNAANEEQASSTGPAVSLPGTVSIPLAGVTLNKDVQFEFTLSASEATLGTLTVAPSFPDDTRLDAASGVSISAQTQTIPAMTIPGITDPTFVQATVGAGNITMAIGPVSGTVTGFTRSLTLAVTQDSGGLSSGVTNNTWPEPTVPLAGETINREAISLSGSVELSASNAEFSGMGTTGLVFSVAPNVDITTFSSVTMNPGTGFEFEQTIETPLSQDMRDWVTSIEFTEVGLKLQFTNGLPAGNPIPIRVTSLAFDIDQTQNLLATNPPATEYSFTNGSVASPYSFVPELHENIDFTFELTPPGYNSGDGTMTLTNLAPGETFGFSLDSVEPVTEWTSITVDPQEGYTGSFPETGGDPLDLSMLTDYLGDGLGFADIPMYLYISGPEFTATATVSAFYNDGNIDPKTKELLPLGLIDVVDLLLIEQTDAVVTTALGEPSAALLGFNDVLNDNPSDLSISYSIDITAMTILKQEGVTPPPLKADLVIILPVAFKADGPLPKKIAIIEFDSLMGEHPTDLLGRKEGEEDKSLDDVFENLKSMAMKLDINNNLGLEGTLVVSAGTGTDLFSKPVSLGSPGFKTSTLDLTKDNIEFIKRNNPFTPSFRLEIPNGTYHLKKNGGLDVKITLSIETDIDYSIDLQGGK